MKNKNQEKLLYLFLSFFSISVGVFSRYRDLWLASNNLTTSTIANITSIASVITILVFLFFTIKVPYNKLKTGVTITLILKMLTGTFLICLNDTGYLFLIKFVMFFDIAFNQVILSSIYPLMISINKSDEAYTKKTTIEEISNKVGFLIATILIGKYIASFLFDYNMCLLTSVIFIFLSFLVLLILNDGAKNKKDANNNFNLKKAFKYFQTHKIFYLFFITDCMSSIIWSSILGLPLLTLTENLHLKTQTASFIILFLGIVSNLLAMKVVKKWHFQNDQINLVFKYGLRLILYLLVFLTGSRVLLLVTIIYLLILDQPFSYLFGSYFINKPPKEYSFFITVCKYSTSLLGDAIGIFICGLIFNLNIKYLTLPALIIGIIHYLLLVILFIKRENADY